MLVRTPDRWAVAVRRRDGAIHTESHLVAERWKRLRHTFLRGVVALVDAVSIGLRASEIAVRESTGVRSEGGAAVVLAPVAIAVVGVFIAVPAWLASRWDGIPGDAAEAAMRAAMLLVYLLAIGRSATVVRVFAYHGAEHKTIAAFERHGRIPTFDEARAESPIHVRCGTDFLSLFVIACGVVFAFVPREPLWAGGLVRVALVPVAMSAAYELMRIAARYERSAWSRLVTLPGRALQRITTREPVDDQIEVALAALREASPAGRDH